MCRCLTGGLHVDGRCLVCYQPSAPNRQRTVERIAPAPRKPTRLNRLPEWRVERLLANQRELRKLLGIT